MSFKVPEKYRWHAEGMPEHRNGDKFGCFFVPGSDYGTALRIIASEGDSVSQGWEHVSVSTTTRTPTWDEMCMVKDLFWDAEDCVVQFHPPRSEYVNNHPYTLHLWRHRSRPMMLPPSITVGHKGLTPEDTQRMLARRAR